jgi:N6-L-threonylcarbamoyladenine synthase
MFVWRVGFPGRRTGMKILGIETSCDDTAASVVEDGVRILSSVVASQDRLHERFGGVVPEIACRAHIESILPVMQQAVDDAGVRFEDVEAVAVTTTPGLIGALLIGVTAAKSASWALGVPLIGVNHLHAHIYGAWMGGETPTLPAVSLVVSGGHTSLFLTSDVLTHKLLGRTTDDAAGEAFDKAASILRLGYPGGPVMEKAARGGNPRAVELPRGRRGRASLDFSFSGIKTAVLYHCLGQNASKAEIESAVYEPQFVADVAASFQDAVVDVLVEKTCLAAERTDARGIILGGGVACNLALRERMKEAAEARGLKVSLAPPALCRDNGAVVAGIGYHLYKAGRIAPLSIEAMP